MQIKIVGGKYEKCKKESFVVIGKEGSSSDGAGFIQKLWNCANSHFEEIQHLAKKMQMERFAESGEQCLISPVPFIRGRILTKVYILRE